MDKETAVAVTLGAYLLVMLGIGVYARGRSLDEVGFFLGGRRLGPVVAALSASASSSSAWTLLSVSGAAYAFGLGALWIFPACVGGFAVNWFLLAPRLRDRTRASGALTVTSFLAEVPGPWGRRIRVLASAVILLSFTTYVSAQFQGAGKAFHETFGVSRELSICAGAGIVLAYTLCGGFWAVSLTDAVQGTLMAATAVLLPAAAWIRVGGIEGIREGLSSAGNPAWLDPFHGLPAVSALGFVLGFLGIGFGYPGQPHVVNRFMAMRGGGAEMRRARFVSMAWAVLVYAGMISLGISGRVLFPGLEDKEKVFLTSLHELFPPVVSGIMLASVLSAIMSTADSQLLVAGAAVSHDLRGSSRGGRPRSRTVVFSIGLLGVVFALFGSREIYSVVLFAWSGLGSAFGPLLLVRCFKGPVRGGSAFAAILVGFLGSVSFRIARKALWPEAPFLRTFGEACEYILPFLLALGIALAGAAEKARSDP